MKVPNWMFGIGILALCMAIWGKDCDSKVFHRPPTYGWVKKGGYLETLHAPPDPAPKAADKVAFSGQDDAAKVLRTFGLAYDVPSGLLYGIWQKEGARLGGNAETEPGFTGAELNDQDGPCYKRFGAVACQSQFRSLVAICDARRDGARVCDPRTVRLTHGFGIGPMGLRPTDIVSVDNDLKASWTRFAADGDGDGAVDPASFADSSGVAAAMLRASREESKASVDDRQAWARAAERFVSGHPAPGTSGAGVLDHWKRWCGMPGNCGTSVQTSASR